MSYQQGYETVAQSMNGVVTYNDGQGTIIQNGTIITNSLEVNNLSASEPTQTCSLFANQTATGIDIGNPLGTTYVRSYWMPQSGYDVINYLYLTTTYYANLLGLTNVWTGVSNTFNNVIYVSLISPIGANLSLGSATNVQSRLQNSSALVVGQTPSSIVAAGLTVSIADNAMRFYNISGNSMIDFFSSTLAGNNNQSSRIRSFGGTAAQNSGTLALDSGSISINAANGTLGLYSKGMAINASPTGDINISATGGVVAIEGLKIDNLHIQPITSTATVEICRNAGNALFMGNSTGSMSITGLGTAVDSAGSLYLGTNTTTTALTLGNLSLPNTLIKNSNALVIGKSPETYVTASGLMTAPGVAFKNVAGSCQFGFHSNTLGNTENDARILVQGGAASGAATAAMTIQAGTISLLGTTDVKVESFTFNANSLQSTNVASTVDFFNNGNTNTLNVGNNGTTVNIGGTRTNLAVNSNYSLEVATGGNTAFIDFHAYGPSVNDYDARIFCDGASAGVGTGTLQFFSSNNKFNGAVNCLSGLTFANSNFSGQKMMGLSISASGNIAPLSSKTGTYTFAYAFGSIPFCIATNTTVTGNQGTKLTISCYGLSTTTCHVNFYNQSTATTITGTYTANILGFGNYT